MSDNFLLTELNWDNEEELFDLSEPASGKRHYAHVLLHVAQVTKHWKPGVFFTIPGVTGGRFNDTDDAGNMQFKSYTEGGKDKLYVFVATKQNQQGEDYQIVKQFPNRRYRKGDTLPLHEIVMPSLKESLSKAQLNILIKDGLYMQFDEVPTGETFTSDDGEEHEIMTWGNFQAFENEEEMKKAENEFFSQFSGNAAGSDAAKDYYPQSWAEAFDDMLTWAKSKAAEVKDPKQLAVATLLVTNGNGQQVGSYDEGQPATAINGQPVPVKKVLAELLDVPEPTINL